MRRPRTGSNLGVWLNGLRVGRLLRESAGAVFFQYEESWIANSNAFPVSLSLPMREERFSGASVVAVFDNLLPDNAVIRRRLAERMKADGRDTFSLLEALGRDCVGALQFLPSDETPTESNTIQADSLSEKEVGTLLRNLHAMPLGVAADQDFRISVAGAQEKNRAALLEWRMASSTGNYGHNSHFEAADWQAA